MARRKKTEEQMDIFEEGGLKDEGGTVDPVSGNDVPPGSTQEEVRDDIPAQLSEGEFVFPADVTRYIGLENLMELRQKAKMGLQKMEDMGQMGNSEEAIMSDSGEFEDSIDKTIEALPMAMGGMVTPQPLGAQVLGPPAGNTMPGQSPMPTTTAFQMQPSTAMNQTINPFLRSPNIAMAQGGMVPNTMKPKRAPFKRPTQNFQVGGMPQPVPTVTPPTQVPTYAQFMGSPAGALDVKYASEQYIGPNGDVITITTTNGRPNQPIPEGYRKYNPATDVPPAPAVAKPEVQQRDGDGTEDRAREEEQQKSYSDWADTMATYAELSPEVAEQWSESPHNPKSPNYGRFNIPANIASDYALSNAVRENIPDIAEEYGLDPKDYENEFSFFGLDKYDEQRLAKDIGSVRFGDDRQREADEGLSRTARETSREMEGFRDVSGIEPGSQEARDSFNEIARAAGRDDLTSTQESFAVPDYAPPDFSSDRGDRDNNNNESSSSRGDEPGESSTGASNPGGDVDSGPGSGFGYSKGGAVKPKRKKGLGHLK
uniref:hypothetical protein n=1 Tax=Candidatus Electrothrix sp. TaxID=2170559 RepID=UPI004057157C